MPTETVSRIAAGEQTRADAAPPEPCVAVLLGASGDLTRRFLMPAFYHLACDRLLPDGFALIAVAPGLQSTDQYRTRMAEDIRKFTTRPVFDPQVCERLLARLHSLPGNFADAATYQRLAGLVAQVEARHQAGGNVLFHLAVHPALFGMISDNLGRAGFGKRAKGWTRLAIEGPFGHDLDSAVALNRELLAHWSEDQIYRMDPHPAGAVQDLLAFRFSDGAFEALWNKDHVDHIQFTVSETAGVEGRGNYYDRIGVLRDTVPNHLLPVLATLCLEPPAPYTPEAIRVEQSRLLNAVRLMRPDEVPRLAVRGQYGPGTRPDGMPSAGYREQPDVNPRSGTETFAALKLHIDTRRWDGVPVYLRSGKAMQQRGAAIIVQFKQVPGVDFRDTPAVERLDPTGLFFRIQPDRGDVRRTGYEALLHNVMTGDATLFSRTDLVEAAWRIAQPVLAAWADTAPEDFPNYPAGSWGPKAAFDLIEHDGRRWVKITKPATVGQGPARS
jgi:glucose-6-phosphate 1-dehydrogenase